MPGRIVLFGATGYTGELTAEEFASAGVPVTLAGRDAHRLEQLAARLDGGMGVAVADVARPATVANLVEPGDVLVTTVGPFARHGGPAVRAAIGRGAHYVDSTGEPAFIRRVFEEFGPQAQRSGSVLLTAFGYDCVPGHVVGALALEKAGQKAVAVDIGYFSDGSRWSGGTMASLFGAARAPSFAWRGGRLVTERSGARTARFDVGGRRRDGLSFGGSEHFGLPRSYPRLQTVGTYLGWFGPMTRAMQVVGAGQAALERVPGVAPLIERAGARLARGSTGGADAATRARSRSTFVAVARDARGEPLATARLHGVDGYTLTARLLLWAARQLRDGAAVEPGARGPIEAFGLEAMSRALAAMGLTSRGRS